MLPARVKVDLGWVNFLVMRRTHATLMKALGADGKAGSGSAWPQSRCEPEHLYAIDRRKPTGDRKPVGKKPPGDVNGVQNEAGVCKSMKTGAGDGGRTRDVQRGKMDFDCK